jgi:5-methylcytosine-specific restriction endonuclease McrA
MAYSSTIALDTLKKALKYALRRNKNGIVKRVKGCNSCLIKKSLDNFYNDSYHKSPTSRCKECILSKMKVYYIKNNETIRAKRVIYQREHRKEQYVHNKRWKENNPEKVREADRLHYVKNKEYRLSVKKEWRVSNPEKVKAIGEKWRLNNLEKVAEKMHRRRAKLQGNGVFKVTEKELLQLYGSPCMNCGAKVRVTIDHITPIKKGGRHSIGNLQPLCLSCNSQKGAKTMVEWKYGTLCTT